TTLQKINASGIVSENASVMSNAIAPAAVTNINQQSHRSYRQSECYMDSIDKITRQFEQTQYVSSPTNRKPSNNIQGNKEVSKAINSNQKNLLDDYDEVTYAETNGATWTVSANAYDDYETDDFSAISNTQKIEDKPNMKNTNSTNQRNQSNRRNDKNLTENKTIINQDMAASKRIFNVALKSMFQNTHLNQRQVVHSISPVKNQKKDAFYDWLCSSSTEQSLWSNDIYRKALLQYIDAQMSLNKWEDSSRIDRRLTDLKLIFEFNSKCTSSSCHPFIVSPPNLQHTINRDKIRSYFDLGCGDGSITAAIGAYLGLNKEYIFGSDIYEGQSKNITFIKVDESQSTINLPDNSIDLITSFVTFHHISQIEKTITELFRILRSGGYLILREHNCKNDRSLAAKYLNFVHAIMMIARVGEFATSSNDLHNENQQVLNRDYNNTIDDWMEQKSHIIEYIKTISYRSCDELREKLENTGFHLLATFFYGASGSNPQNLFYAVYQLNDKLKMYGE
ncbi:unnamed protein product, partial [Adineta steineri]